MTWKALAEHINNLTPEQQLEPVQAVLVTPNEDDVQVGLPVIGVDTVQTWGFLKYRSSHNNKYCGNDIVLLLDHNPYSEDGIYAYEVWDTPESSTPLYINEEPTRPEHQWSPQYIERLQAKCGAELHIGDDFSDNHATMRCQLERRHDGPHRETYQRDDMPVVITWHTDDREDNLIDEDEE